MSRADEIRELAELNHALGFGNGHKEPSGTYAEMLARIRDLTEIERESIESLLPFDRDHWHEDDGEVLWWKFPITEAPYVGSPLCDDFPDYVTHWTRIPIAIDNVSGYEP